MTVTDREPSCAFATTLGDLADALATVAPAVPSGRTSVPILTGVLFESDGQTVTASAFDYETSIRYTRPCAASEPGRSLVRHPDLVKITKAAAKGDTARAWRAFPVGFAGGPDATVDVAGFGLPLDSLAVADYPQLPKPGADEAATFTVDRDALADRLGRLCVSAGTDDTLPMLRAVNVSVSDGAVRMATTDRFRLGIATLAADGLSGTGQWNLPCHQLARVVKLMPAGTVTISLPHASDTYATVECGPIVATVRLVDAEFPRYRQLIPTPETVATVDRAELLRTLVKVEALTDRGGLVRVDVTDGTLAVAPIIRSDQHDRPATGRSMPADVTGAGEPIVAGFNPRYLRDAVEQAAGADRVAIGFNTGTRPAFLAPSAEDLRDDNAAYRQIVMPARLGE